MSELLITLGLILLNGWLSMSEITLISSKRLRLEARKRAGSRGAARALALIDDPNRFLSTIQVGITLVGILTGVYSGAAFSSDLEAWLIGKGLQPGISHTLSVIGVVGIITYLSLILGELVPKKLGLRNPEGIAVVISGPMSVLARIASPIVYVLTVSTQAVEGLLRLSDRNTDEVTEEEVKSLISHSGTTGQLDPIKQNLLERVFAFGNRRVGSLMRSRLDIEYIDGSETDQELLDILVRTPHQYLVVCEESLEKVRGVVYARQVLNGYIQGGEIDIEAALKPAVYLPESMTLLRALKKLRGQRQYLGVVVSEFGETIGVVALPDITDALIADLADEGEQGAHVGFERREDGSYRVAGTYPFAEFIEQFDLPEPNQELVEAGFNTVAGFVLYLHRSLPQVGTAVDWHGHRIEVAALQGNRIESLNVWPPPPTTPEADPTDPVDG